MGIFFSFDDDDLPNPVGQWFIHLFEHLSIPFVAFGGWFKGLFRRDRVDDIGVLKAFLERDMTDVEAQLSDWAIDSGRDMLSFDPDDSPQECQAKVVVKACRPDCYDGTLAIADLTKLRHYLETPESKRILDEEFYLQLSVAASAAWTDYRNRFDNSTLDIERSTYRILD